MPFCLRAEVFVGCKVLNLTLPGSMAFGIFLTGLHWVQIRGWRHSCAAFNAFEECVKLALKVAPLHPGEEVVCASCKDNTQQSWWSARLAQRHVAQKAISAVCWKTWPVQRWTPKIFLIAARERSTACSRLQSRTPAGSIQLKSAVQ